MEYNYQEIVDQLKNLWTEKTKDFKPTWFKISVNYVVLSSEFLLGITDILVNHFQSFDLPGLSKKEKCIEILSELFDFVKKTKCVIITASKTKYEYFTSASTKF